MVKPDKHEADIVDPRMAIEYWRDRAVRQGTGYVSRGGKNSDHQAKVLAPIFKELLAGQRFKQGLDYGCGWGRFTAGMARYCDRVVGVDLVDRFREHPPDNVEFHQLDYPVKIPVPDDSVNLLFLIMVLQHITGDEWFDEVTKEITRTLAPNATVIIVDDITATAGHVRPRSREALTGALNIVTSTTSRELAIDSKGTHQLIFGQSTG